MKCWFKKSLVYHKKSPLPTGLFYAFFLKSPVVSGNVVSDEDYFVIKMHRNLPFNVNKSTHDNIKKLFDKFTYQYDFKWEDVAEVFKVKKSRASEVIALLLDSNLIEPSEPTRYKFKK